MSIYFFSTHAPDPKMLKDLGAPITAHYQGEVSDIKAKGNKITFTETKIISRENIKACHIIPADSIVIVDGFPLLQQAWLAAGISTLLVPQMKSEVNPFSTVLKYSGLMQIHKIEVISSPWDKNSQKMNTSDVSEHQYC
jgi:hypothetical protein